MATNPEIPARDPRHALGAAAEDAAAAGLAAQGMQILLRNWRRRTGELDIVARQGDILAVVEVRLRSRDDYGTAASSVDRVKRRRIIRTTQQLLQQQPELARLRVRFDVIAARPCRAASSSHAGSSSDVKLLSEPTGRFELEWIRHAFSG